METIVRAQNLVKRYKERAALGGLSLAIGQGQLYGLVGPNGAGKTTLIRILCGLLRPDGGEAEAFRRQLSNKAFDDRRRIGAVAGYDTDDGLHSMFPS